MFTIAYHNMCRIFRKWSGMEKLAREISAPGYELFTLDESIDYQSILGRVKKLIDQLPPGQREIFIKSRKEGKSTKEIAAELNIVPGTVDNQVSEALKFLRKNMGNSLPVLLFLSVFIQ
jgi:RNA polymerase sigma-70 factor (ECF subfamily)